MPRCSTCYEYKDPKKFIPESKKCDECRGRVKPKSTARKTTTTDYNDNEYLVGMFVGEFKGLRAYNL